MKTFKRLENGLLEGIEYPRSEDGSINWREMIKDEHLYPNAGYFERAGKAVPKSIKGLDDSQLLIKLGGIKDLAKTRGFKSVKHEITHLDKDYVVAKCSITWLPNEENQEEVVFEDVANATPENCSGFATKFLETIAANRAFVRAVRNFLGVHIVGDDEIDKSEGANTTTTATGQMKPHAILKTVFDSYDSGGDWSAFKKFLRTLWEEGSYRNLDAKNWSSFEDIPPSAVRKLISIIKKEARK